MKPLFLVLAKLAGLLHLYWTVTGLMQMAMMFSMISRPDSAGIGGLVMYAVGIVLYFAAAFVAALILLFRTDWLADKLGLEDSTAPDMPSAQTLLQVGVQLIGLYALILALPALIRQFATFSVMGSTLNHSRLWSRLLAPLLQLALGLFLALRASRVVAWISPQNGSEDPA